MNVISFFNNKGGVGKTTTLYHVGYKLEQLGNKVLFVDGDPQCNLTSHLCNMETIEFIWGNEGESIYDAVKPIVNGFGDVNYIQPHKIEGRNIWIYPGDLLLSEFDAILSESWTHVLATQERGFRATTAVYRLIRKFAEENDIDYILLDLGPNLGSLNRALLLSCTNIFIPLIPDLFSLRGSQNLGRTMANWVYQWKDSVARANTNFDFELPKGSPIFSGYIVSQFNVYRKKPVKAWRKWENEIPQYIREYVYKPLNQSDISLEELESELKIGQLKNFNALIPMAQSAMKPIFELISKDGIIGDHKNYVDDCSAIFEYLVKNIIYKVKQ
ncbi:chromosome partitioning protein [Bacillus amyloliquefaciens]|uniref:ParA family protein n=1 Tax=Bacillus amyloliquefaciens TaxID=1390 RepID=UPI000F6391AA|nr:ParA family protein [Bacillus amyloliquefaciens]QBG57085.1 chromosome partitioning protein [Bacillus amyloliquefaciens]